MEIDAQRQYAMHHRGAGLTTNHRTNHTFALRTITDVRSLNSTAASGAVHRPTYTREVPFIVGRQGTNGDAGSSTQHSAAAAAAAAVGVAVGSHSYEHSFSGPCTRAEGHAGVCGLGSALHGPSVWYGVRKRSSLWLTLGLLGIAAPALPCTGQWRQWHTNRAHEEASATANGTVEIGRYVHAAACVGVPCWNACLASQLAACPTGRAATVCDGRRQDKATPCCCLLATP